MSAKILAPSCVPDFHFPKLDLHKYATSSYSSTKYAIVVLAPRMKVYHLEDCFLADYPGLYSFELGNQPIHTISNNTFTGANSIRWIRIHDNSMLSNIEELAFRKMRCLEHMVLKNNHLMGIDDQFKNLANLRYLNLQNNKIERIKFDAFVDLQMLDKLYLSSNKLRHLHEDTFKGLHKLTILELDDNMITSVPSYLLKPLQLLEYVDLSQNPVANIPDGFFKHSKLISIKLGCCRIDGKMCHDAVLSLTSESLLTRSTVSTLNIWGCLEKISNLKVNTQSLSLLYSNNLHSLSRNVIMANALLSRLSLCFTGVEEIEEGAFDNLEVMSLELNDNNISYLAFDAFTHLRSLMYLRLSNNLIDNIPETLFRSQQRLIELRLDGNKIEYISDKPFRYCDRLSMLDLSRNKIKTLTDTGITGHTWPLKMLDLGYNRIEKVSLALVKSHTLLSSLNLRGNNITDVSFLTSKHILDFLDISNNSLKELTEPEIRSLKTIGRVHLFGNPWKCSCDIEDRSLMDFLLMRKEQPCCPEGCSCTADQNFKTVNMNCSSKNLTALPICIPFKATVIDFSHNSLENLSFTQNHENITSVSFKHNKIERINGPSLLLLHNLTSLDLSNNLLETLPAEMRKNAYTKIHLEGNKLQCDDCDVIKTLISKTNSNPQIISCANDQTFTMAKLICLIKNTVLPYIFGGLFLVFLLHGTWNIVRSLQMKRLAIKYTHLAVSLNLKEDRASFKQERQILQAVSHQNIRQLHKTIIRWIPFIGRKGHFYLENVQFSLFESKSINFPHQVSVKPLEISRQIISTVDFLHNRDKPITHGNLDVENILLVLDQHELQWRVKIGDFSHAQIHDPSSSTTDLALSTSSNSFCSPLLLEDMQAVARIIFFLLTGQKTNQSVPFDALLDNLEVHLCTLIIAFQRGLTANEALNCTPTFESLGDKSTLLSELNAFMKQPTSKKVSTLVNKAAENVNLIIGGQGAWNKLLDPIIIEDYASGINTRQTDSFLSLLRIIRNIIQHPEHKNSMLALCGKPEPSLEEILAPLLVTFPWFYPHAWYCASRFFDTERTQSWAKVFISSYKDFEDYACNHGLANKTLAPLQELSYVTFQYKRFSESQSEQLITSDTPKSCIILNDLRPQIIEMLSKFQIAAGETTICPPEELIFRCNERGLMNPFQKMAVKKPELGNFTEEYFQEKMFIPEGSIVQIFKPEIQMEFPQTGQIEKMAFKPLHNIKAIKGYYPS